MSCLPSTLQTILEQGSEKIRVPKSTLLFRRGEKASGMFLVLRGRVTLDFGVDTPLARSCGPGALVGLPATLTKQTYSMTATVTDDAELGFWSIRELEALLRRRPDLCHALLAILSETMREAHEALRASRLRRRNRSHYSSGADHTTLGRDLPVAL